MTRKVRTMPTMAWGKSGLEKDPTRKMTTNPATVSSTPTDCIVTTRKQHHEDNDYIEFHPLSPSELRMYIGQQS